MAASPKWKVYTADNIYIASVKHPEYGAMLLASISQDGATLRYGHVAIVWTEGIDGHAAESYDRVSEVAFKRCIGPMVAS